MNDDTRILQAYLDGELTAEQADAVGERLQRDPDWRRELEALRQLWSLVDSASVPAVESSLWPGVAEGVAGRRRRQPWTLLQGSLATAALVAGLVVGFGVGSLPDGSTEVAAGETPTDYLQDEVPTLDAMWLQLGSSSEDSGS